MNLSKRFLNSISSGFSWKVIALVAVATAAIFAVMPRKINVSRAESCSPVYHQPVFNPYPVTFQDPPEDCKDYPLIEGRTANGSYPHSQQELDAGVTAHENDQVHVLVYFHNGASENDPQSQTTIHDFKITTTVDTTVGGSHNVSVNLSGSNVQSLGGSMTIHTASDEHLEIVPGSGILYDFQTHPVQGGFDVGNNVLNMQDFLACFSHSGFVRFTVKVVKNPTQLNDNAVCINSAPIPATNPGQPFSGSVSLQNTGTTTWTNGDRYSARLNGGSNLGLPGQLLIPNASTVPPGASRTFNFNGTAPTTPGTYNFSYQMVKNGVVFGAVCPFTLIVNGTTPTPVTLTIEKQVRNVSDGTRFSSSTQASTGNTVEYKIVVTAHGGTSHNTTVTDNFPSGLAYINGTLTVNGQPHATGLTNGINFGDLNDGQSLTIIYRATVVASGPTTITNTATAHGSNTNTVQDSANVIVGQNHIRVVCAPSSQNVVSGQAAYFTATGGNGSYTWSAPGGYPSSGNGSSFSTSYTTGDVTLTKTITVSSDGTSDTCELVINPVINSRVVCTPGNQNVNVNQTAYFTAVGGNGQFTWSAPGANQSFGTGSNFSTSYSNSGNYTVTVTSSGISHSCNVQVNQIIINNQIYCNPSYQTINVNQTAYFSATGGNGSYSWQAPDGNPSYGYGSSFQTNYSTGGNRYVTVTSGGSSANCSVNVNGTVQGTNTSLSYSKRAWNDTRNQDATSVRAGLGDTITYTLTVSNSGNGAAQNFVISDDLSQVLDKADLIDNGGGTLSGNVISFPGVTVPANGSVTKSFRVKVKTSLASNQTYTMSNTYGNTVNILIGTPQVLGTFIAPTTGAAGVSAVTFAGLLTLGFVGYRKRKTLLTLLLN